VRGGSSLVGKGGELDEVDRAIIEHLQDDGRRPYREIARALGVSEGTVRWRVRRMVAAETLRIVALANPYALGQQVLAFVLLAVEPGRVERVIEALLPLPEVTYVSACTGRYDIYLQIVCRDQDHLLELLSERIPSSGAVRSMETFMELSIRKVSYKYPRREEAALVGDVSLSVHGRRDPPARVAPGAPSAAAVPGPRLPGPRLPGPRRSSGGRSGP